MSETTAIPNFPSQNAYGPITAGQLYERTFALLRDNFRLFSGIVLVAIGVEIIVGAVLGAGGMWTDSTAGASSVARVVFLFPIALVGGALVYLFTQIIQGALFFATQSKLARLPLNVGEACRLAADNVGRILGISALVALRIFGYMLLFQSVFALILLAVVFLFGGFAQFAGQFPFHSGSSPSIEVYIVSALIGIAIFIAYLACIWWLVARYAASIPACLAESLGVTDAIRRSIQLTARDKGRIYALLAGASCAWVAITAVTFPVEFMSASMAAGHAHRALSAMALLSVILAVFRIVVSAMLIAFIGVATTLCYYDLRVRKEAFGVLPPPSSAALPPVIAPDVSSLLNPDLPM